MRQEFYAVPGKRGVSRRWMWAAALLVALILSGCSNEADAPASEGAPAASTAQVAAGDPAAGAAAAGQEAAFGSASRIPLEVGRLAIAEGEAQLRDFRLDAAAGKAYVTDSSHRLYVITLEPLAIDATFETTGDLLTLDTANARLYIAPFHPEGGSDPAVTIFDTAGRAPLWTVLGSRVAVDSANNRYYVGDAPDIAALAVGGAATPQGVRLYDGATQQLLAQGEAGGIPLYNPLRDELIVLAQGAVTVDPATLATREQLFPEIAAEPLPGCTGCRYVRDGWVLAEQDVVAFDIATLAGGAGAGVDPGASLYDAATLAPLTDPRQLGDSCSSLPLLLEGIGGRYLHHAGYSRYAVYNNLVVEDGDGTPVTFKDGLGAAFVNPVTAAAYVPTWSNGNWIVDAATLAPLGVTAGWCPWAVDDAGVIYAADASRRDLLVLAPAGGSTLLPVAEPLAEGGLAGRSIRQILLSPAFLEDATMFVVAGAPNRGDQLLRSVDAGGTWTVLGGLPTGEDLTLTLAIAPDFGSSNMLFLGGARSTYGGEGVWRSTDRGESWAPLWNGLDHLRVQRLIVSPHYAEDSALLAYSDFVQIDPWQQGVSVWRSGDGGASWQRMSSAERADLLPAADAWLPLPVAGDVPVRKLSFAEPIQVEGELGTWSAAAGNLGAEQTLRAVLPAPDWPASSDIYVVTDLALYRTQDSGASWQQWQDARAQGLTWERLITAAALSPVMGDGTNRLLLGTADGNLWQLDPATLSWGAPVLTAHSPSPTPALAQEVPPVQGNALLVTPAPVAPAEIAPAQVAPDLGPATPITLPTPAPVATAALPTNGAAAATPVATLPAQPAATTAATPLAPASGATPIGETTQGGEGSTNGAEPPSAATAAAQPTLAGAATETPTSTPAPAGTPVPPEGIWGSRWANDPALQAALGMALTKDPATISTAYQFFENGVMFWREDVGAIYAVLNNGTWQRFEDTFREGDMERDPNIYTPGELLQPERGFGKVWRENDALREAIGWGRQEEEGVRANVQEFEKGFIIRMAGLEYIVLGEGDSGTWRN